MGKNRKPWIGRQGSTATCAHCGGISTWFPLPEFRVGCSGRPRVFGFWYWWGEFKKHHKKCINVNYHG